MKKIINSITKNKKKIFAFLILSIIVIFGIYKIASHNDFQIKLKTTKFVIGKDYINYYTATYKNKDVTDDVKVTHNIYSNSVGKYQVLFTYAIENKEYKVVKTIEIVDKDAPEIILNNGNTIFTIIGEKFIEPGYTAIDNYEGDITSKVKVTGSIDVTKEGTYTLKYVVSDSSKNKTTVKRKVIVTEKSPLDMSLEEFSLDEYYTNVLLDSTKNGGNEYSDKFIVIGDSTALMYYKNNMLIENQIWYLENTSLENIFNTNIYHNGKQSKETLISFIESNKPTNILVTFGTDSIEMDINYFIERYEEFLKKIKEVNPDSNIIVQSIFPVLSLYDESNTIVNNAKINKMNYMLLQLCSAYNIPFLNTAKVLKNENGTLKDEYANGKYLSILGNKVALEYFQTHMYEN